MSYQEKRLTVATITGLIIFISYCYYGLSNYISKGSSILNDLHFWATAMLVTIIGGIIAMIIIQIIFHILLAVANEVSKEVSKEISKKMGVKNSKICDDKFEIIETEDEMDKLIALKSLRVSSIIIGSSFFIALVSIYFNVLPAIALNIIFISFASSTLIEGLTQLHLYKNGVKNE